MARVRETGKALEGDDRQTHKQIYGNYRIYFGEEVETATHSLPPYPPVVCVLSYLERIPQLFTPEVRHCHAGS